MAAPRKSASAAKKVFLNEEVTFDFADVAPLALGDDPYSDSEAIRQTHRNSAPFHHGSVQMGDLGKRTLPHTSSLLDNDLTDDDNPDRHISSIDEFADGAQLGNKLVRTGRQRKKLASRTKGGEFQARRRKRRLYFCCVSSEIDVYKLHDYFVGAGGTMSGWKFQVTADVLHLYRGGPEPTAANPRPSITLIDEFAGQQPGPNHYHAGSLGTGGLDGYVTGDNRDGEGDPSGNGSYHSNLFRDPSKRRTSDEILPDQTLSNFIGQLGVSRGGLTRDVSEHKEERPLRPTSSEIFIFEFGACVFWGFPRGEEINFLKTIRMFVTKGYVAPEEFQDGVDDMAFVTLPEVDNIEIANDVLNIPEDAPVKQRLAVSFAIAQSTVLAIFESRVYKLIEDYKYIPEALAAYGKIHLSGRQLGKMIGDVFVIRHDVNLHTEILDIPDFFWKDGEKFAENYLLVCDIRCGWWTSLLLIIVLCAQVESYLEMDPRTEVLNKRLDMLRELLDVLQQQMENAHSVKLEWIVIWLIVIEVLLQVIAIGGESLGFWGSGAAIHNKLADSK
jgi:uncharacterized Rmd1/YagE family protein